MTNSVRSLLASSMGRRDEHPNIALAEKIVASGDTKKVEELIALLQDAKQDVRSDCIKALYEIGDRNPAMIVSYADVFVQLLTDKQNRMQWGAMHALSSMASLVRSRLYKIVPKLLAVAAKGSVITRDHMIKILAEIGKEKKYSLEMFHLLNEQLLNCPVNQLPSYAEKTAGITNKETKSILLQTIALRLKTIEIDTKRKRLEKLIKILNQ